jgi:hypothetical protein
LAYDLVASHAHFCYPKVAKMLALSAWQGCSMAVVGVEDGFGKGSKGTVSSARVLYLLVGEIGLIRDLISLRKQGPKQAKSANMMTID